MAQANTICKLYRQSIISKFFCLKIVRDGTPMLSDNKTHFANGVLIVHNSRNASKLISEIFA